MTTKLNKALILSAVSIVSLSLVAGCSGGGKGTQSAGAQSGNTQSSPQSAKAAGEAHNYERILMTGPCPYSTLLSNKEATKKIVGINSNVTSNSNIDVLKVINPDIENLKTDWISSDYKVNVEAIMSMKPDALFHYAAYQNPNNDLQRTGLPVYDLEEKGDPKNDPELTQNYWEHHFEEVNGLPKTNKYADAWKNTKALLTKHKDKMSGKTGMVIWSNNKSLKVSAPGTYQDTYLQMAGLTNVVKGVDAKGDKARFMDVSMEQVIQWNPDYIFVIIGGAKDILDNKVQGQDWSKVSAVQNKHVFAAPLANHNWGNLGGDTPLFPLWMINRMEPSVIPDAEIRSMTKEYYKKMYNVDLTDKLLDSIFQPR